MKIYVACLAAYNSGILHGAWIAATSDPDEMQDEINAVLASSPVPDAEEWAIHDYDDFPNMGEYPGIEAIAKTAELIETAKDEHGIEYADFQAIAANWHGNASDIEHALESFAGIYDHLRDFSDVLADSALESDSKFARDYFDYDAYARDMAIEYTVIHCPSGVAVFWPH